MSHVDQLGSAAQWGLQSWAVFVHQQLEDLWPHLYGFEYEKLVFSGGVLCESQMLLAYTVGSFNDVADWCV